MMLLNLLNRIQIMFPFLIVMSGWLVCHEPEESQEKAVNDGGLMALRLIT